MRITLLVSFVLLTAGCVRRAPPLTAERVQAVVASGERPEADRALDEGRKPAAFLSFLEVGEGMRVGELMAGFGYTVELLSRAVGPTGAVYGENPKVVLERFAEQGWAERVSRLPNVKRADRELDDPFAPEMNELDVVVSFGIYHDSVWLKTDRAAMNRNIFRSLKMGGRYVVCDSSARGGRGTEDAESLHRIDERLVRSEILAAGFTIDAEGNFLRNPADTRDWNSSPRAAGEKRGTSDRFCLRFVKPVVYY